jgi:hypothetical protein
MQRIPLTTFVSAGFRQFTFTFIKSWSEGIEFG